MVNRFSNTILRVLSVTLIVLIVQSCSQPELVEPTNRSVLLGFSIPESGDAQIKISNRFDTLVKTFDMPELSAGYHTVHWDGKDNNGDFEPQGIYWVVFFFDGVQVGYPRQLQLLQPEA